MPDEVPESTPAKAAGSRSNTVPAEATRGKADPRAMSVSVVIPCFNHGRYIVETVTAILAQTHAPAELLVVDDCSSDDSCAKIAEVAARDSRIKLIRHEKNQGASASRNDGIDAAISEYVAFCDADDLWVPSKLEVQLELLAENPDADMVYADATIIDGDGTDQGQRFSERYPLPTPSSGNLFDALCIRNFVNMQTVLCRKRCFTTGLRFDRNIKWVEDWWFWIQVSKQSKILYAAGPLAKYRVHARSTNMTQARGNEMNRFKVYKRVLKNYRRELRPELRIQIWYHAAACLSKIGWARTSRRFYGRSFRLSLRQPATTLQAFRPLAKMLFG